MGIGAGLFGFVQGASSSLGAAAAQQVQSDIDLERRLSLEQILEQRKNARNKQTFSQLWETNQEELEAVGVESAEEAELMLGTEAGQTLFQAKQARTKEERDAEKRAAALGVLQQAEENPGSISRTQFAAAAKIAGLDISDLESEEELDDETINAMADFFDVPKEAMRGIAATDAVPSLISKAFNREEKKPEFMTLYDPNKNEVVSMDVSQAAPLIEQGKLIPAKLDVIDDMPKIVAGGYVIDPKKVKLEGEENKEAGISRRRQEYNQGVSALHQSPAAARANINFANPQGADLGGTIEAVRGISDSTAAFFRGLGPTASVMDLIGAEGGGTATIGARKELSIINGLTRRMFDVMREGRGSNADITLADAFNAGQNPFQNILGSEEGVELALTKTRDLMVSMRNTALEVLREKERGERPSDSRINNAKQVISVAEQALGHIDNMFAVDALSTFTIMSEGRPRKVTQVLKTPSQIEAVLSTKERREQFNKEQQALLTFYYLTLLAEQGLDTNG